MPDRPGIEHCVDSDGFFDLPDLPKRVLVIGGGYIAAEFTAVFAALNAETTWSFRYQWPLRHFDILMRETVMDEYKKKYVAPAPAPSGVGGCRYGRASTG